MHETGAGAGDNKVTVSREEWESAMSEFLTFHKSIETEDTEEHTKVCPLCVFKNDLMGRVKDVNVERDRDDVVPTLVRLMRPDSPLLTVEGLTTMDDAWLGAAVALFMGVKIGRRQALHDMMKGNVIS